MKKLIAIILFTGLLAAAIMGFIVYKKIFSPNVQLNAKESFLYIATGTEFEQVVDSLIAQNSLKNVASFKWVAHKLNYDKKVLAGKYRITNGMNNKELVQLLRSGKQTPVKLVFNNIRTAPDLAERIAIQLEVDSSQLMKLITDSLELHRMGFDRYNILSMFIPNTYEFYWNTSAEKLFNRMHKEYKFFWNESRKSKAKQIGLTPLQVSTLASIVESETKHNSEKSVVAGVYINRLQKNWKLEADPTLVYAMNDFTIKRVLNEYKSVDSPYNTYKYTGLPPGPICLPTISSIDAVLNYTKHDYMYFCAREDLSGFHAFAVDYSTHLLNAKKYQSMLNKINIRK